MLSEGFLLLKICNQMLDKRKILLLPHPRGERYDWLISGREAPWRVETGWAPQLNERGVIQVHKLHGFFSNLYKNYQNHFI